ncbi:U3 small nucleolar RNA-associated protein 23 [Vigna unguiculata]|uniref:U3 small nucleolar RNA-associated protein 23 n=1 Tax=Vigna unguiculata TaxID=3917 RepID=A0A4D6LZB2_VIGUN|nr:U3 small nucleolar RNA-associated protein 23 [Vigna unguiculata]
MYPTLFYLTKVKPYQVIQPTCNWAYKAVWKPLCLPTRVERQVIFDEANIVFCLLWMCVVYETLGDISRVRCWSIPGVMAQDGSSPYLRVFGDDRVRGTREQMMLQVVLVERKAGAECSLSSSATTPPAPSFSPPGNIIKMKLKKQKRHRKTLTFYTTCFGVRKPYKVLCDGTFVHHLLVNRITPADIALGNILGASVKLYTTRCVLAELKRLGSSYSETLENAHKLIVARCEHDKCVGADACIKEAVGEKNSEHFFVASQDTDLRKKLQEVPGVPLIYGLRNALFLESPSAFQRQYVKTSEEERLHMTEKEYKILKDRGPNPLSCKKKSKSQNIGPSKETKGDNEVKRSRKRKRSHKRKMATEGDN